MAGEYNITDHGAVADGASVNTGAIQDAVDACAAAGGGRVVVPAGVFMSGAIFLKSRVEFHLSSGAVVRAGSGEPRPRLCRPGWHRPVSRPGGRREQHRHGKQPPGRDDRPGAVGATASWNVCSHAFSGSRWIRDTGTKNSWLPLPEPVDAMVRSRWTQEQVDGIYSVSRVEANARDGVEVEGDEERRRIYLIESRLVDERLVVFEDGELLRTISDPDFHPHREKRV